MRDRPQLFWFLNISVLLGDLLEELPSFRVSVLKQLPFFSFSSTQVLIIVCLIKEIKN